MDWKETFRRLPRGVQEQLLTDRAAKGAGLRRRIIWGTDAYAACGEEYGAGEEITAAALLSAAAPALVPMAAREAGEKKERVKRRAAVFTPAWVCKLQNDLADEAWRNRKRKGGSEFEKKMFRRYVDRKVLEITCGEAPYLTARYDAVTGEEIPLARRAGLLDRKLALVTAWAETEAEWMTWARRAVEATYGYEYQGDSLLLARMNALASYAEYRTAKWGEPGAEELARIARILSWNLWQMDGLSGTLPAGALGSGYYAESLFGDEVSSCGEKEIPARVHDWRGDRTYDYKEIGQKKQGGKQMKFDVVIGNPPYQDEFVGEQKTFLPPIYHVFMDEAYKVGKVVELIHPARFLFNAGSTPKAWNQKMLKDPHLKVVYYEADSAKIFPGTDIKGGCAVTYRDVRDTHAPIEVFTHFAELNSILQKVAKRKDFKTFSDMIYGRNIYRLTDTLHKEHPEAIEHLSKGHAYDLSSNIFDRLSDYFFEEKPDDGEKYVRIYGRQANERVYKWIKGKYINRVENFDKWKVFVPKANGTGAIGEILSTPLIGEPLIGEPLIGVTETFISIGALETQAEAEAVLKYVKSKFARAMLGVLKVTQDNTAEKWLYVPLQDFTDRSDIDWTRSVHEIDLQLYKKYGLTEEEVSFIESKVKEMK